MNPSAASDIATDIGSEADDEYRSAPKMPTSSIAQIFLRIFALSWFLTGVIQLVSVALTFQQNYAGHWIIAPGLVYVVAGILVWAVAPKLSRALVRPNDGELDLRGITERQLYAAVFLGLGLYFTLSSFAASFSWVHFFTVNRSADHGFHRGNQPSYYNMSETLMTLAAGLFLMVTCKTWADKLARKQPTNETSGDGGA